MARQKSEIAVLNSKIDALGKKTGKWRDEVQTILVMCAKQSFIHGNVDPFTRLVDVLVGSDMRAVIRWIETYAPAIWQKKESAFRLNKSFEGSYDALFLMGQAWWKNATKAQEVSSVYDVLEVVQAMLKRADKEVNATNNIKTIQHKDLLGEIRVAVTKYEESQKAA